MPYLEEQTNVKSQIDGNEEGHCVVSENLTASSKSRSSGDIRALCEI